MSSDDNLEKSPSVPDDREKLEKKKDQPKTVQAKPMPATHNEQDLNNPSTSKLPQSKPASSFRYCTYLPSYLLPSLQPTVKTRQHTSKAGKKVKR